MPVGSARVSPARLSRLGALGALAVAGGVAMLFALFVFVTRPTASGGMDLTNRVVAWISVGGVALVIIVVHLVYARDLMRQAASQQGPGGRRVPAAGGRMGSRRS